MCVSLVKAKCVRSSAALIRHRPEGTAGLRSDRPSSSYIIRIPAANACPVCGAAEAYNQQPTTHGEYDCRRRPCPTPIHPGRLRSPGYRSLKNTLRFLEASWNSTLLNTYPDYWIQDSHIRQAHQGPGTPTGPEFWFL